MKKYLLLFVPMLLILAGCSTKVATTGTQTPAITPPSNTSLKFIDQPYYSYSYLISTDNLGADAQTALTGFKLDKKVNADGSTEINLKSLKPEYADQHYTLKPGEQLYFIEKFLADDTNNEERNIKDDSAVVVDAKGNVVQPPANWSN